MDEKTQQQVLKSLDSIAQNAHMLTGACVILLCVLFKVESIMHWVILGYIFLTAWKEFWYDMRYEIPEIRGSSAKDFIFYQLGWALALILYLASDFI